MEKNYNIVEATYDVDFMNHKYAVLHLELINCGETKHSIKRFNNYTEATNEFDYLVQFEKFFYNFTKNETNINVSHLSFISGFGAHEDDKLFGIYDTKDGELVSQVLLVRNSEI